MEFALSNPIEKILEKRKQDFTREDLLIVILEKGIERITFHYTALDGKLKELKIPITNKRQAETILACGERVDGSSLFKGLVDVSGSDLYVIPVYKTAFLNPFDEKSLDFICRFVTKDGELAPFAMDTILANAHKSFKEKTGLEFFALGELEFFLMSKIENGLYPLPEQKGYHASEPFIKKGKIVDEMIRQIAQITGSVKYGHSEVGHIENVRSNLEEIQGTEAEQLEIEFLPTPVEETSDNLVLAKWLIRNIAYRNGCVATFAPKIEEGVAGNGLHIHSTLKKYGKNCMTDSTGELSVETKKLIGGFCNFATSLTAFGNTVSSAYLRLTPNQEAPTKVCWSKQNRSAMIRVPLGWAKVKNLAKMVNQQQKISFEEIESRQTIELRTPDGSAFVHLLLAGMVCAAEWGFSNEKSLEICEKSFVEGDIVKNRTLWESLPKLPNSCVESAKILESKRELYEQNGIFPKVVIDYTIQSLKNEKDEEMNEKLSTLPADDRLHETRKIMHKDLHKH